MPSIKTGQEQCPACAENGNDNHEDNLILYEDGSAHCHACGYDQQKGVDKEEVSTPTGPVNTWACRGIVNALPERALTKVACEKYNVKTGFYTGSLGSDRVADHPVYVLPIYEDGALTKQKIRSISTKKMMTQLGQTSCMELFGKQAFSPSKKVPVNITEGEFDAVAGHQASGYAFVSVVLGAGNVVKEMKANYEWLTQWAYINICFDNDEAGQKAVKELDAAALFAPGFLRVVTLSGGYKDANEMVMAGKSEEFKQCLWGSAILKPPTLVDVEDLAADAMIRPQAGPDWPWKKFTEVTSGIRPGDVYIIAATKGIGKTLICQEIVTKQIENGNHTCLMSLEQTPSDSLIRFVGSRLNARLHIPGCKEWDDAKVKKEIEFLNGKVSFFDRAAGTPGIEGVLANMRYSAVVNNTTLFVIDNLRSLSTNPQVNGKSVNKVQYMSTVVSRVVQLAEELGVTVIIIQHLSSNKVTMSAAMIDEDDNKTVKSPTGTEFRTGRVPQLCHIYGSGEVVDLVSYVMVLARNAESEDEDIRNTTTVKFLTARLDGSHDGATFRLKYNKHTGRLEELEDTKENDDEDLFDTLK